MTTGLGSVNVANLVDQWNTVTFNPTTSTLTLNPTANIAHGSPVNVNITVSPSSGTGVPTGNVTLMAENGPIDCFGQTAGTDLRTLVGGSVAFTTYILPGGGPYCVWAHYAGDTIYAPSDSNITTVTVTPEPSTTTVSVLTANQSGQPVPFTSGPFGSFVYLRADVAGLSGYGVPTGSVTFLDNGSPLVAASSLALDSQGNTATPNGILNFDTGTHTISATYSGDASFNPSSTTQSQSFTITPGFFITLSSPQSAVVISAPGSSGTTSFSLSSSSGFTGSISFSCSKLPTGASCTFSPTTVTANGTPATTPGTITITTTAATAALRSPNHLQSARWLALASFMFLSFVLIGNPRRRSSLPLLLLVALLVLAPACRGGGATPPPPPPATAAGTYSVLVTAASNSTTSTTVLTLVVQ